jgi:hypothetical protein
VQSPFHASGRTPLEKLYINEAQRVIAERPGQIRHPRFEYPKLPLEFLVVG